MKAGRLLWGIFWILLGSTYLAVMNGYVDASSLEALFSLWPVLVILVGLNYILKERRLFALVGFVLIVGTFGMAIYKPFQQKLIGSTQVDTVQSTQTRLETTEKKLEVTVDTGAVALDIHEMTEEESRVDDVFVEGRNLTGDIGLKKEVVDGVAKITVSEVDTEPHSERFTALMLPRNLSHRSVKILLNRKLPVTVILRSGAANEKLDFSKLQFEGLVAKSGAVNSEIRLGTEPGLHKIDIESGASNYKFSIARDSGYRVITSSGLTNVHFPNGAQLVNGEMERKSDGYDSSVAKYEINLKSGLTNLELTTY